MIMDTNREKVIRHGFALRNVKNQNAEICLIAVKHRGNSLRYVKREQLSHEEYYDICLEAVKSNPRSLKYVIEPTFEICMEAISRNPWTLQYVPGEVNNYETLCMKAIEQKGKCLKFVKKQTREMCLKAVSSFGGSLSYVKEQDVEICREAIINNKLAIKYVKPELLNDIVSKSIIYEDLQTLANKTIQYNNNNLDTMLSFIKKRFDQDEEKMKLTVSLLNVSLDEIKNNNEIIDIIILKEERNNLYEVYKKESKTINNGWLITNFVDVSTISKVGRFLL